MQKEKFDRCVSLLRKYYSEELLDTERQMLEDMLQNNKNLRKVFQGLTAGDVVGKKCEEYEHFNAHHAFNMFYKRQNLRYRRIAIPWIAAAVVIVIIGVGCLVALYSTKKSVLPVVENESIQPGSSRAILRLADGRTINFDKDSVQVREKNGIQINYAGGRIAYQSTEGVTEFTFNELIVPIAGECYIVLNDGSKVWVNADSKLKYPVTFAGTERKVYLEGEAYFEVVKDSRPFSVVTQKGEISVLGTGFGISAYSGKTEYTTLVHGKVKYTSLKHDCVELSPGEQAVFTMAGILSKRVVDIDEYVGWKDGIFVFNDKSLEEIMEMLQRWYGADIIFEHEHIKQLKYTGKLERYDSINIFFEVLERLQEVHYEVKGNTILLSEKHKTR